MSQPAPQRPRDAAAGPARLRAAQFAGTGQDGEPPARGHRATPRRKRRNGPRRLPPRWVLAAGVLLGSVATAIAPLPLSGFLAWLIAWCLIAVFLTGFVEFGRRRWLPRIASVVRRDGEPALRRRDRPVRGRRDLDAFDDLDVYEDYDVAAGGSDTRPWTAARPRVPAASGPAGRRTAARQRAALAARQIAVPKTGVAPPPEAIALADRLREFRSDDGDELQAWCDELAAAFYVIGEALSDAHDGMVNDTGLDEIPAAAVHALADQVVELGAGSLAAKDAILKYYDDVIGFAEAGGKMTKDGRFWEQH